MDSPMQPLYEYVCHMKGHRNSDGELAEWVIKSHETGEILSSHKSEKKAKEHLQQMHIFGESVEGEAACSHCGCSAYGVEEYNGRLFCPYCLKEFQRLDACRDDNGYVKYDNITKRSDGFNPACYKLIGESTYGTDMDKRVQIFMEGVSQLGLSKNQVDAIGKITKVCTEGIEDGDCCGGDYNPYDSIEIPSMDVGDGSNDSIDIGSMDFGGIPDDNKEIGLVGIADFGNDCDVGEIGKISEDPEEQPEF